MSSGHSDFQRAAFFEIALARKIRRSIWRNQEPCDVVEAIRRVDLVASVVAPNAHFGVAREKAVDAFRGTRQRRIKSAEFLLIPEMDASLVADLDRDLQVARDRVA